MALTTGDTTTYLWRVEAGEREVLVIPVLDDTNAAFPVSGWTVDAQVEARPGGVTLYTWPAENAQVTDAGTTVTLTIPGPVSEVWTWRRGYYRVVITDPASDVDDPNAQRILQGPFVVDPI